LNITGISVTSEYSNIFTVEKYEVESNGLGIYLIKLNRQSLATGTYRAEFVFQSNINEIIVPVFWQVSDNNFAGNIGYQSILLVNPDNMESIKEIRVGSNNGIYSYTFNNIKAGKYIIVAGSDNNNDKFICDAGESCGAYLTISKPSKLSINNSLIDVDFSVNFNTDFLTRATATLSNPPIKPTGFARIINRSLVK
jgi:serine protease